MRAASSIIGKAERQLLELSLVASVQHVLRPAYIVSCIAGYISFTLILDATRIIPHSTQR
jgi:hypothetical protein